MDARRRGQARELWVTRREPRAHVFLRRALARIITNPRRRVLPTVTARRRVWRRSRDLRARAPSCATHLYGDVRSRRARFRAPRACASTRACSTMRAITATRRRRARRVCAFVAARPRLHLESAPARAVESACAFSFGKFHFRSCDDNNIG